MEMAAREVSSDPGEERESEGDVRRGYRVWQNKCEKGCRKNERAARPPGGGSRVTTIAEAIIYECDWAQAARLCLELFY
jgi:hypothetical protein